MLSLRPWRALLVSAPFLLVSASYAQFGPTWRDRYDVYEYQIPARDGVKLYTLAYVPKGKTGPFPILLERTPYGAGSPERGPQRTTPKLAEAGYIFAFQDVRGKGKSEGDFVNVRPTLKKGAKGIDESTDTYDTVEFLTKTVPQNSKRVGLWGISYPGFYAGAGAIRNHPMLKAVSPQAPVNDWFMGDDVHHHGVFFMQEVFDFSLGFNVPRGGERPVVNRQGKSAYQFFLEAGALSNFDPKFLQGKLPYWNELMENSTYNEYWKSRALWRSFKDVNCAVLTVGGLFDKEDLFGAWQLYKAGEKQNTKSDNYIVMGPWSHGQWAGQGGGSLSSLVYGEPTSKWYQENVEFPFFERHLRGDSKVAPVPEATVFETGFNRFRTFAQWPPKDAVKKNLYMDGATGLSWQKPKGASRASYQADPAAPTPYVADWETSTRAPGDWLARNQKFSEGRQDTATFTLPALTEDLRIAGPIYADLWITTTGTDGDFVVKLIDEYPADTKDKAPNGDSMAGYQMMVRGEIMRAKFRDSFEKPKPIVPGVPTRVRFMLNDVLHRFRKGHTIKVRVQSSWFPIADRNPNVFTEIRTAKDSDFKAASISVLTGGRYSSSLELGILK